MSKHNSCVSTLRGVVEVWEGRQSLGGGVGTIWKELKPSLFDTPVVSRIITGVHIRNLGVKPNFATQGLCDSGEAI